MNQKSRGKDKKTIVFPGRLTPPHKGHIAILETLLTIYDRVVIVLGSCYEVGTPRHPLLAIHREKMLLYSLKSAGVDLGRITVIHLQDFDSTELWWQKILTICRRYKALQICTGNITDIVDPITAKGLWPEWLKLVNPEKDLPRPKSGDYHSTDLREAVRRGDYELFLEIAAPGTVALMGNVGGFVGIRQALANQASHFVRGRQAVDAIIVTEHEGKCWILAGIRNPQKRCFPGAMAIPGGAIRMYENPIDATLREVEEETGLRFEILDRTLEPAHLRLVDLNVLCEMKSLGIFSSTDKEIAGDQGGSSQPFLIRLDLDPKRLRLLLKQSPELEWVDFYPEGKVSKEGLAFQQLEMVRKAGYCL